MSDGNGSVVSVKIVPNDSGNPKGKLADVEVIFGTECGPFQGLRLIGFGIWERRDGGRNVTFPARQFEVNGTKRSFVLLRSVTGNEGAFEGIRQTILDAYTAARKAPPDESSAPPGIEPHRSVPGERVLFYSIVRRRRASE